MVLARIILIAVLAHMGLVSARMTGSLYALSNKASTFTVGVILALFSLVPKASSIALWRRRLALIPALPWCSGVLVRHIAGSPAESLVSAQ